MLVSFCLNSATFSTPSFHKQNTIFALVMVEDNNSTTKIADNNKRIDLSFDMGKGTITDM